MIGVVVELSSLVLTVIGDALSVALKSSNGTRKREVMSDVIPLDVPQWAQYRVYTLQLVIYTTAKALYII